MAKLISLQGANVTLPSGLSINSNSNMIYSISGEISYIKLSGTPTHLTDSFSQIAFGYNLAADVPTTNLISYVTGTGAKTKISTDYNFSLLDLSGNDVTNPDLIQWFLDINATIEGGIYEEEHKVQIINPQMYILPPTKVVGKDLIVSAEEVVVNEAEEEVKLGTINYNQTDAWLSIPIHRSFEIGMTWEEFINSDYNKVQNDIEGYYTISGQFILSGNYVKFYGKRTDNPEPYYSTLSVLDSSGNSISKTAEIKDGYKYISRYSPGGGGGAN